VLWRLIPKGSPFAIRERAAAIWALGHIDVGDRHLELSRLLQGRLADAEGLMPEEMLVRTMSAVSLGRMKDTDAMDKFREFYEFESPNSPIGLACRWAIHNITGEWLPGPTPRYIEDGLWSLMPLRSSPSR